MRPPKHSLTALSDLDEAQPERQICWLAPLLVPSVQNNGSPRCPVHHWPLHQLCVDDQAAIQPAAVPLGQSGCSCPLSAGRLDFPPPWNLIPFLILLTLTHTHTQHPYPHLAREPFLGCCCCKTKTFICLCDILVCLCRFVCVGEVLSDLQHHGYALVCKRSECAQTLWKTKTTIKKQNKTKQNVRPKKNKKTLKNKYICYVSLPCVLLFWLVYGQSLKSTLFMCVCATFNKLCVMGKIKEETFPQWLQKRKLELNAVNGHDSELGD